MSTQKPLVSIGIPTYNRPAGLRRIIQEMINQTYFDIEIIVSDNHSSDPETEQIGHAFMRQDPRVKYVRQPENIGILNNYKFLLAQAQGEYFAWVCDDDFRDPTYIAACMEAFDRLETPILINSYSTRVNAQTGQLIATDHGCTTLGMPARDRYIKYISTIFTTQAAVGDVLYGVIKREFLVNALSDQVSIIAWDHPLLARLALLGEFYTIPMPLMSASNRGVSSNEKETAKAQLMQGTLSERMPFWVREIHLQRIIRRMQNLNPFDKIYLAVWSYTYYLRSHGFKMWVKGASPTLFAFLRKNLNPRNKMVAIDK
jgi:glycosyltransferase involved in cell wall biosynthesis